ncbi:MAG: zinc ribbon domain-containing protein [Candidatus Hermodarchaeota archaeon]
MPKFCVYCGNPVKESDKYCIICGKPLITNITKPEKKPEIEQLIRKEEAKKVDKEVEKVKSEEEPGKETFEEEEEEKYLMKFKKPKEKKDIKPLPEDVKEQMVYYIEFNDIQLNKDLLLEKLNDLSKSTKDERYEYDLDFKKEVNIKLEAIKTLISELKERENIIKQNLKEPFIVQRIQDDIDEKIFQLKNLTREYKLHKVDKETFEKLRDKYKEQKSDFEEERENLIEGMKLWIQELKLEKAELSSERKLNKGRYHAKEITEDEFNEKDKEFDLRLKKIDIKIDTLEKLTK